MSRAVWQISAGPTSRSYADVFLMHGVTLIGPGDAGQWKPERDDDEFEGDLVPLLQDRQAFGELPSEDELIAHFVVPFLRALGWPAERIAVKWRRIDVTAFQALPRTPENCHLVIEAKRFGAGVEGALEQAKGYSRRSAYRAT